MKHAVAAAISVKAFGSLLFIFGSSVGAYLLLLHQIIITPILYDFYNYDADTKEFNLLFAKFAQNLALFGALLFFIGMKNSIPRRQLKKKLEHRTPSTSKNPVNVPFIDLEAIDKDPIKRKGIVDKVRDASETWGFFQVVNHGIPVGVLEEMDAGARRFFDQDIEVKKTFYTRDVTKRFVYNSNFDLHTAPVANWRDTFFSYMAPYPPKPEELPGACRDIMMEFSKQVTSLGISLLGLLSEALGLRTDHLEKMDCAEGLALISHYYPACPEPELTLGTSKHSDNDFLTVLLQDQIGGLQMLHQDRWVDIPPVPGALVINIGDLMQASFSFISVLMAE
ncbi:hypothetical protein D5086_019562 [Populus alba]|uniref:Uncharacterized protein n=1 Tax=Populus alba TaxID=43335 RepID=A0ACC4BJ63_POPAL